MMKKITALLLCLVMALSLCACGKTAQKGQDGSGESSVPVNDLGEDVNVPEGYELKVAFSDNNAPFSYVDGSGNVVGLDVDIVQAICESNKWTLTAKPIDWATSADVLDSGEVDCVWGATSFTRTSKSDVMWSVYGGIYVDAVVLDDSELNKVSALKGKHIEVEPGAKFALEGASATELGKQLMADAAKVDDVADAPSAYKDLAEGKCDAIVVSAPADDQVDFESFGVSFKAIYDEDVYTETDSDSSAFGFEAVSTRGISDTELGAGFAGDTDVFYALTATLENMIANGEVAKIMETWSQKDGGKYTDAIARCSLYQMQEFTVDEDGDASVSWDIDPYAEGDGMDGSILPDGSASVMEITLDGAEDGSAVAVQ